MTFYVQISTDLRNTYFGSINQQIQNEQTDIIYTRWKVMVLEYPYSRGVERGGVLRCGQ